MILLPCFWIVALHKCRQPKEDGDGEGGRRVCCRQLCICNGPNGYNSAVVIGGGDVCGFWILDFCGYALHCRPSVNNELMTEIFSNQKVAYSEVVGEERAPIFEREETSKKDNGEMMMKMMLSSWHTHIHLL